MDTTEVEASYARLLEAAASGPFAAPAMDDEWSAERVVAHVIANDRLLAATVAEVLAGERPSYDNRPSQRSAYLDPLAQAAGGWSGLVEGLRRSGRELAILAGRLDDEQTAVEIPAYIEDRGRPTVNRTVPIGPFIAAHARVHLPAHAEQLLALRERAAHVAR